MTPARSGYLVGTTIVLALSAWFLGAVDVALATGGAPGAEARHLVALLFTIQGVTLALVIPMLAASDQARSALLGTAGPVLLPLPLLSIAWMVSDVGPALLLRSTVLLLAGSLLACALLCRVLGRVPPGFRRSLASAFALAAATTAWMTRAGWVPGAM